MKILVSLVFNLTRQLYFRKNVCVPNILKTIVILLGSMLLNSDFEHLPSLTAIQVYL